MFAVARDFGPAVLRARVVYRQIAALVLESDAVLHTTDPDFLRCAALRWLNPLTGTPAARRPRNPL